MYGSPFRGLAVAVAVEPLLLDLLYREEEEARGRSLPSRFPM